MDKSLIIDMSKSFPISSRCSKLVSHTDLHSLRSGFVGVHLGMLGDNSEQCHLAKPVVPGGHG